MHTSFLKKLRCHVARCAALCLWQLPKEDDISHNESTKIKYQNVSKAQKGELNAQKLRLLRGYLAQSQTNQYPVNYRQDQDGHHYHKDTNHLHRNSEERSLNTIDIERKGAKAEDR